MTKPTRRRAPRPPPTFAFRSRASIERHARARKTALRLHLDDGMPTCEICFQAFTTTGNAALLVLLNTGHVFHRACATRFCLEQRRRELTARGRRTEGDPSHTPKTAYYCEFGRAPLTTEEVDALELPAWPADGAGWALDSDGEEASVSDEEDEGGEDLRKLVDVLRDDNQNLLEEWVLDRYNIHERIDLRDVIAFDEDDDDEWDEHVELLRELDVHYASVLMLAVFFGAKACATCLIDLGADVNFQTLHWRGEPFHLAFVAAERATFRNDNAILELLLASGMRVDFVTEREWINLTVLTYALFGACDKMCEYEGYQEDCDDVSLLQTLRILIKAGADALINREGDGTSLKIAVESHSVEVVRLLLDHGAAVDVSSSSGWTALMFAAEKGRTGVVTLLLGKGASVDKVDHDGKTALDLARDNNHTHLVALLERAEAEA